MAQRNGWRRDTKASDMTRDYSEFSLNPSTNSLAKRNLSTLEILGWSAHFAQQISIDDLAQTPPVRIIEVHRNALHVLGDTVDTTLPMLADVAVGDWLLYSAENPELSTVLARKSLIKRRAPGTDRQVQLIAANIDTAFIVTSCNHDFNIARLERYVALVFEAEITPVILLTKADLCDAPQEYAERAREISDLVQVVVLDARGDAPREKLGQWCKPGKTIAFLGSSGVGKSTLTNALSHDAHAETQAIREADSRGRHTTTKRQLHIAEGGFSILDTPGMRELQMTDVASGIDAVFADLQNLADQCKFNDCQHETEPGCAVSQALKEGLIDAARLRRWRKLVAEDAFNSASLSQRRAKDRNFGKTIRQIQKLNRKRD